MDELLTSPTLSLVDVAVEDGAKGAEGERRAMRQWLKKDSRLNRPVKKRQSLGPQRVSQSLPPSSSLSTAASHPQPVVAKEARAALVAEWLVRHFGERLMRGHSQSAEGTQVAEWRRRSAHSLFIFPTLLDRSASHRPSTAGVVDVAGGKGHLAYLLATVYHIPTAVVDPRPLNLGRYQIQYQRRLQHMKQRQANSETPSTVAVPAGDGCHLLTHFRCYFPASVPVTHIPHEGTSASPLYSQPLTPPPAATDCTAAPATASSSQQPTVHSFVDPSPASLPASHCASVPVLHSYLAAATLLVGLHADGATEAIVDFALQHNKPFAVVPCCVFCNDSGERILDEAAEGTEGTESAGKRRVRSYEDFIAYLTAKDGRIRQHTLPFQGRNLCLYMNPQAHVT